MINFPTTHQFNNNCIDEQLEYKLFKLYPLFYYLSLDYYGLKGVSV